MIHDYLGHRPYQRVQGEYSYKHPGPTNTLDTWMGIKPMPSRHTRTRFNVSEMAGF